MRRIATIVLVIVLALCVAAMAFAVSPEPQEGVAPTREFVQAPGTQAPTTTIPQSAVPAPSGYESAANLAQDAADAATVRQPDGMVPVAADLPPVPYGDAEKLFVPESIPHLPLGADAISGGAVALETGGYQSDRVLLTDYPDDVYAIDYYYWMRTPQTNEWNRCDSTTASSGCFWFPHMNSFTNYSGSSIHSGPQRGSSAAGSSGSNWRMNVDGYVNNSHVGGQGSTNLPQGQWVRVRTWRLATGYDSWAPYTPWSTWGVWALFGGTDLYQGSLKLDGHWFTGSYMASEIYESSAQCSTDFVGVYLDNPRYRSASQGLRAFAHGTADYEANCSNTSWSVISSPDYIHDGREVTRTIAQGATIW